MAEKTFIECDNENLQQLKKYQLPHSFKKIGIIITVISFLALFANAFTIGELLYREISKYGMLVGLLFVSVSKEKIEDELITNLRMQSYTVAFIGGVFLSLVQPFINYGIDSLVNPETAVFKDSGDFVILWILLGVQVCYFEVLKKIHR